MVYGIIYLITNKINGKQYVGQTIKKSIFRRWTKHIIFSKKIKQLINISIQKYGIDNFHFDQIDTASTKDELNWKEKYYIHKLNTLVPNGYNLQSGGNSWNCHPHTKIKISQAKKGKVIVTDDQKRRLSEFNTGKILNSETKRKISIALKGVTTWNTGIKYNEKQLASRPRGELIKTAKITETDVKFILSLKHLSPKILSEIYNVNITTITHIRRRVTWKHVDIDPSQIFYSTIEDFWEQYDAIKKKKQLQKKINMSKVYKRKSKKMLKFTKQQVLYIKESTLSSSQLGKELGVSTTLISRIRSNKLPEYVSLLLTDIENKDIDKVY